MAALADAGDLQEALGGLLDDVEDLGAEGIDQPAGEGGAGRCVTLKELAQAHGLSLGRLQAVACEHQVFPDERVRRTGFFGPDKAAKLVELAKAARHAR